MELINKADHDWRRCDECHVLGRKMVVLHDNYGNYDSQHVVVCGQCLRKALRLLRKKKVKRA
jgi:hypothetical protein